MYLGIELLVYVVFICLPFEELEDCFPKRLHHSPLAVYKGSSFLHPCQYLLLSVFLILAICMGVECYPTMVVYDSCFLDG